MMPGRVGLQRPQVMYTFDDGDAKMGTRRPYIQIWKCQSPTESVMLGKKGLGSSDTAGLPWS